MAQDILATSAKLRAALDCQAEACRLIERRDSRGEDESFDAALSGWVQSRRALLTTTLQNPVDALVALHMLRQDANAIPSIADEGPESLAILSAEMLSGLNTLVRFLEAQAGTKLDALGLHLDHRPPNLQ